jgi:hypothetical protein
MADLLFMGDRLRAQRVGVILRGGLRSAISSGGGVIFTVSGGGGAIFRQLGMTVVGREVIRWG